jgi:hypothetical protein
LADDHHAHPPAEKHMHGSMDVAEHERMFEAYVRFWVYVFGAAAAVLIFLAIFNS